jgi:hypothetical protein
VVGLSGLAVARRWFDGEFNPTNGSKGESMKIAVVMTALLLMLVSSAPAAPAKPEMPIIPSAKAEIMGRVEDFFLHNFRDVTWRKSIEWGEVQTDSDGVRSITYNYEAKIWDKETMIVSQVFTFAADGKFLSYKDQPGFPKKKASVVKDVSTQKGMIALVDDFFSKNFRDVTARETIEWGEVKRDEKGNSSIRYKYNATIWDKDKKVIEQVFTFDPKGEFVSVTDVEATKP